MHSLFNIYKFLTYLNLIFALLIIFFERRNPSATWAWLMVLILIPGVGFILYLLLGQNLSRRKMFSLKTAEDRFHKKLLVQGKQLTNDTMEFKDKNMINYKDMVYMHLSNSQSVFTQDNNVKIYTNGYDKFNDLLSAIENAKHHIHMVYYIIKNDSLGNRIIDTLTKKALEGVEVRLLYDGMGGIRLPRYFFNNLKRAGGKVACFFPSLLPLVNIRVNYRNHRKIAVIDGREAYVGGFNIGDEYLGKNKKFGYWRDTHIRVTGSAVDSLQQRFLLDWRYASAEKITFDKKYFPTKHSRGEIGMQIVSSGPDSEWEQIKNGYLKMIQSAKQSIYIQTPYFIPDESIFEALKIASLSGVEVKIMIPSKPDHPFVYWASLSYVGDLLKSGAQGYAYNKGFIHSKTIVVDGKVCSVGTANMDVRSFKLNFEVNAFIYDSNISSDFKKIFKNDINDCTEITKQLYEHRSIIIKFKESISRLLSPVL
ncbi:cardiolipin synthase [Clostridium botulinum]|uniref:cardiolipin synthase n=1 Tax=Clostridium botulinum TaxID=1491 RepID=UPI0004D4009A|nr:cardiolipin synthase [Clostridium botulinum]KEI05078.1 phospholipase D [Clostridium botulinum C/D str. BKT75002]KEI11922.1 phospholipase D [Clostridium botulinum C/D str. BKT2873]MCD3350357.1 cardiolipin synthase [Clostridium botulinum D/C]MCD3359377.1 cardiolipin synthase [Clostridium botulinum D/C]MCD3361748.1 cardiolipin synthase [Clostridium botulinum D/C]